MNRRELLKMITVATGTAMIGGNALFAYSADAKGKGRFEARDTRLLDEIAETILPRTDTPGAKDARVGEFMTVFVTDCYTPQEQEIFHNGLAKLDALSRAEYDRDFLSLDGSQRETLVSRLDEEAKAQVAADDTPHYFTMIKQLTLFGFFTSEVGAKEVLRFVAVPGRYDGCAPYEPGQPAWATT
ncbi:gluconate 2-dehydrogenase subunit 3 family protein [Halomonas eurihalina]|uniref:Gluconate 2-dehydrogenase subunit 3 family protein n=1 Tax=Halomonas eurihalina TaxID=42566 RepID=A0A5D9D8V5_HALER|nr:gluconate 2-dehydrogenase subunit 3 family protein [Halomonas eurihalina]MDR5861281.1 gluconate 2-dehydrogenase subunit 3 family protein [Halomonas eurihalina]TZG40256.1 gluconate 2-dehydrogenase subunit 3 family protein [Halomonas eurihalina]